MGMRRAWAATKKEPITEEQVGWKTEFVVIPVGAHLDAEKVKAEMATTNSTFITRGAASRLAWMEAMPRGAKARSELSFTRPCACSACAWRIVCRIPTRQPRRSAPTCSLRWRRTATMGRGISALRKRMKKAATKRVPARRMLGRKAESVLSAAISKLLKD